MTDTTKTKPTTKRPRRMAREPQADADAATAKEAPAPKPADPPTKPLTKAARVEAMLSRGEGASLADLCQATGWLSHTCRAFLTGLRKKGRALERTRREDGTTIYKLGASVSSVSAAGGAAPGAVA